MTNKIITQVLLKPASIIMAAFVFATPALADTILTIENTADNYVRELSETDLLALDQTVISTENEFVDGMVEFSGPLVRNVLLLLGNSGFETVILTAANDYAVEVPFSDFTKYDVILAIRQDGEPMSPRDKGPIWVIYPMSDNTELQDRVYNDRLIWQLVKIGVK